MWPFEEALSNSPRKLLKQHLLAQKVNNGNNLHKINIWKLSKKKDLISLRYIFFRDAHTKLLGNNCVKYEYKKYLMLVTFVSTANI